MKKYEGLLIANAIAFILISALGVSCNNEVEAQAPPKSEYAFTSIKEIKVLPVTSQGRSGTCWAYSTGSFLESEIIRKTGESIDLSEMYFVRSAYLMKAQNYIYRQGTSRFTEGGLSHDPIVGLREFGLVPESAYSGLLPGKNENNHAELIAELDSTVKRFAAPANKLGAGWRKKIPEIMDKHMGKTPEEFVYHGKTYTAESFLAYTKLDPDDYLTITSFSHLPFYREVELSIPANWANERFYNVPLDEFIANIDHAITKGYSLALDLDATEPTFTAEIGVIPADTNDRKVAVTSIRPEKKVDQKMRQAAFENFETTDDHLIHITGTAKDQFGNLYYKCKNSWGRSAGRRGYVYLSVAYMRMKGISVLLHKDGLLPETKLKFNKKI
ncbi:C1 family peptidase [Pedobacter steynii]